MESVQARNACLLFLVPQCVTSWERLETTLLGHYKSPWAYGMHFSPPRLCAEGTVKHHKFTLHFCKTSLLMAGHFHVHNTAIHLLLFSIFNWNTARHNRCIQTLHFTSLLVLPWRQHPWLMLLSAGTGLYFTSAKLATITHLKTNFGLHPLSPGHLT